MDYVRPVGIKFPFVGDFIDIADSAVSPFDEFPCRIGRAEVCVCWFFMTRKFVCAGPTKPRRSTDELVLPEATSRDTDQFVEDCGWAVPMGVRFSSGRVSPRKMKNFR